MSPPKTNLTQITLGVAFIAIFALASLWILSPFLLALVWSTMIVIATWPAMLRVQAWCGGRRAPAAGLMTLLLLSVFIIPTAMAVTALVSHTQDILTWANSAKNLRMPLAPQWLIDIPLVGEKAAQYWNELVTGGLSHLKPYASRALNWLGGQLGTVGAALVHLMFTVVIAAILYVKGDTAAAGVRQFFRRLAGERGERAAVLAAMATRGVALGVVVTALAQTLVSGIGLAVSGMPFAGPLTMLILLLCIAQLGPTLVLVPAVIWMYVEGDSTWASVLLIFTVVAGTMDNIVRPYLIKKGADLPILLIFAGVIGGLLSIGVLGIFVGPVVLAVSYRLLEEWVRDSSLGTDDDSAPP